MSTVNQKNGCDYPNYFSDTFAPAVQKRLPDANTIRSQVLDYTTKIPSFIETVSRDLCDDRRLGEESRKAAVGFITRSAASALVAGSATTVALIGVATGAAPIIGIGLGLVGLAILPPLVDKIVTKVGVFIGELLQGVQLRG